MPWWEYIPYKQRIAQHIVDNSTFYYPLFSRVMPTHRRLRNTFAYGGTSTSDIRRFLLRTKHKHGKRKFPDSGLHFDAGELFTFPPKVKNTLRAIGSDAIASVYVPAKPGDIFSPADSVKSVYRMNDIVLRDGLPAPRGILEFSTKYNSYYVVSTDLYVYASVSPNTTQLITKPQFKTLTFDGNGKPTFPNSSYQFPNAGAYVSHAAVGNIEVVTEYPWRVNQSTMTMPPPDPYGCYIWDMIKGFKIHRRVIPLSRFYRRPIRIAHAHYDSSWRRVKQVGTDSGPTVKVVKSLDDAVSIAVTGQLTDVLRNVSATSASSATVTDTGSTTRVVPVDTTGGSTPFALGTTISGIDDGGVVEVLKSDDWKRRNWGTFGPVLANDSQSTITQRVPPSDAWNYFMALTHPDSILRDAVQQSLGLNNAYISGTGSTDIRFPINFRLKQIVVQRIIFADPRIDNLPKYNEYQYTAPMGDWSNEEDYFNVAIDPSGSGAYILNNNVVGSEDVGDDLVQTVGFSQVDESGAGADIVPIVVDITPQDPVGGLALDVPLNFPAP